MVPSLNYTLRTINNILSCVGVQQGDPFRPFVLYPIVEQIKMKVLSLLINSFIPRLSPECNVDA